VATTVVPATEAATHIIRGPFQHSDFITADPIANRDELTRAQSRNSAAAHMSGDHVDRLPYGAASTPNSLDTRTSQST
jgi:hypothetical protein